MHVGTVVLVIIAIVIIYSLVNVRHLDPTPTTVTIGGPPKAPIGPIVNDNTKILNTQKANQASLDAYENAHRSTVFDSKSHAEIDLSPYEYNTGHIGAPANDNEMPTDGNSVNGALGVLLGLFDSTKSFIARNFVMAPTPVRWNDVYYYDPVLTREQHMNMAIAMRANKPGGVIDMHAFVPLEELQATGQDNGSVVNRIVIQGNLLVRAKRGWRLQGKYATAPVSVNKIWDVFPYYEMGVPKRADLLSCPYDDASCYDLWRFITDGRTGTLTTSSDHVFTFDGRIVRPS